jgi:hypothetical protein
MQVLNGVRVGGSETPRKVPDSNSDKVQIFLNENAVFRSNFSRMWCRYLDSCCINPHSHFARDLPVLNLRVT